MTTTRSIDQLAQPVGPHSRARVRAAVAALTGGLFLAALDQNLFATILPTVAGEVGAGDRLSWITTATVLAGAVVMPVLGRLGDDVGRRRVFLAALVVLLLGSVVGGLATNLPTLLGARILQGLGGGGLLVLVEAMVADLIPARRRTWTLSVVGSAFAAASVLGPVLGGLIAETVGWRWAFWLNLPLGAVALVTAARLVPRSSGAGTSRAGPLVRSLAPLAVTVCGLTVLASMSAPTSRPPVSVVVGVAAVTVVSAALWWRSDRQAERPLVPLRQFRSRNYGIAVSAGFLVAVAAFGTVAYLPTYLQLGAGLSPGAAGLTMLATVTGLGASTVLSARIVRRTGHYRVLSAAGAFVVAVAVAFLAAAVTARGVLLLGMALLLLGIGLGAVWEVLVVVAQNVAPREDLGIATAGNGFVREVGVLLGTAGIGAWYASRVGEALRAAAPGDASAWTSLTPGRLAGLPASTAEIVQAAYTEALVPVLAVLAPVAALAALLLTLLQPVPLATRLDQTGTP